MSLIPDMRHYHDKGLRESSWNASATHLRLCRHIEVSHEEKQNACHLADTCVNSRCEWYEADSSCVWHCSQNPKG